MPNDPRVKFHKGGKVCKKDIEYLRKHPECRLGHRHLPGGDSGGRLRSIYEDEEPPPDTGGGGETGGGGTGGGTGGGVTPRNIPTIPQVEKPSLNPGEITGATIGSIAAAAALTEAARRTLEEQRRRRGMQPIPQPDQLRSRQSGVGGRQRSRLGIARGIGRAVDAASQAFEMTPVRPAAAGPIQADFAPLSVESSPSSSGTATPFDTISRPSSGASTPEINISSIRPGARQFQQQPSAMAPGAAQAPAQAPAPAPGAPDLQRATSRPPTAEIPIADQIKQTLREIDFIIDANVTETNPSIRNANKKTLKILREKVATLYSKTPKNN